MSGFIKVIACFLVFLLSFSALGLGISEVGSNEVVESDHRLSHSVETDDNVHTLTINEPDDRDENLNHSVFVDGEEVDDFPYIAEYRSGEFVRLRASPADGWFLTDWIGDASHFGSEYENYLEIDGDKEIGMELVHVTGDDPKDVVLVLDNSGSMDSDQMSSLREGARAVVDMMDDDDRLALFPFASNIGDNSEVVKFTHVTDSNVSEVFDPAIDEMSAGGLTALYDTIAAAGEYIDPEFDSNLGYNDDFRDVDNTAMLVLTDGHSNDDDEYHTHSPSTHGGRCEIAPNNDWFDTEKDYGYDNFDANEYGLLGMPWNTLSVGLYVDDPSEVDDEFSYVGETADGEVSGYIETDDHNDIVDIFEDFMVDIGLGVDILHEEDITLKRGEYLGFGVDVTDGDSSVTDDPMSLKWSNEEDKIDKYGTFVSFESGNYTVTASNGEFSSDSINITVTDEIADWAFDLDDVVPHEGSGRTIDSINLSFFLNSFVYDGNIDVTYYVDEKEDGYYRVVGKDIIRIGEKSSSEYEVSTDYFSGDNDVMDVRWKVELEGANYTFSDTFSFVVSNMGASESYRSLVVDDNYKSFDLGGYSGFLNISVVGFDLSGDDLDGWFPDLVFVASTEDEKMVVNDFNASSDGRNFVIDFSDVNVTQIEVYIDPSLIDRISIFMETLTFGMNLFAKDCRVITWL